MIIGNLFPFFNGICWSMTKEVNLMKDGTVGVVQLAHWAILLWLLSMSPSPPCRVTVLSSSPAFRYRL